MEDVVCASSGGVGRLAAGRIDAALAEAIARRGRAVLALPGGSAIEAVATELAAAALDWSRLWLIWIDERAVDPTAPDSNYRLARPLIADTAIPVGHVLRMPGDQRPLGRAAARYAAQIEALLANGPLDVALVGVGADGHVASLFPGHPALDVVDRAVVEVHDAPKPPASRLTLTLPILVAARLVVVVATGEAKAGVLRAALEARRATRRPAAALTPAGLALPVARLLARAPHVAVIVDEPLDLALRS